GPAGQAAPVVRGHSRRAPGAEVPGPPVGPRAATVPPGPVGALPVQEPGCWAGQALPARDGPPPAVPRPVGACWVGRLVPGPAPVVAVLEVWALSARDGPPPRSEERRVGKEGRAPCARG